MPKNKDAYSRYRIIDRVLRQRKDRGSGKHVRTKELSEICARELGFDSISRRQIQKDIENMRFDTVLRMDAPIEYSDKYKAYYYPPNVDELFPAIELTDEEVSALLFYSQVQGQYQQFEIFKEVKDTIKKVLNAANVKEEYREVLSGQPIIHTEKAQLLKGSELLRKIIQAIVSKKKIRFEYEKFGSSKEERILSPYILKEDSHLWYVVGRLDGKDNVTTFAVDRMSSVGIVNERAKRISFSPKKYFKHAMGVTVYNVDPVDLVLSFEPFQGNYLKVLPIHESQEVLVDNSKELRIKICVKPSYELYEKILSYGERVKVISPEFVKTKVRERLKEALNNY